MKKRSNQKILILKTGYSEVLDSSQSSIVPSLGDIVRTTPLLHIYKDDKVTWLTDEKAFPLLKHNPYIDRLLALNFKNAMHLLDEDFDIVINLEKNIDICKFSDRINAWNKRGFRFDKKTKKTEAYDRALKVLTVSSYVDIKKENKKTVQELLFEMVGEKWNKEGYVLGYKPKRIGDYDIGLNTKIGDKWPTKKWPTKNWDKLEEMLVKNNYNVTRQDKQKNDILTNLYHYMDWINSSKLIISNDSLGMHLGIALKKEVIGLFGPTQSKEVYFYNKGGPILPKPFYECVPCFNGKCKTKFNCIDKISPERVYNKTKKIFQGS